MRKDIGPKTWMYPMPVLVIGTYDENGAPNAMNAGWGNIYEEHKVILSIDDDHKTHENIRKTGAFTVSFATEDQVIPVDYVGVVSANKEPDKFAKAGFYATPSAHVNAPIIDEFPLTLECRLLKWNEDGMCIGEIVNVSVEESLLTEKGKIDLDKLHPLCLDCFTLTYRSLGEVIGKAFSDGLKLK
ncbi:MAG: flavin reductase family protein [Ruminococcaceae bacterium]|nr:flavin reductase family protein [Oscillospiraceae bacterium]